MGGTHEKALVKVWLFLCLFIQTYRLQRISGGYPDGLKGNTIPLEARIVAVADAYDALLSGRPYRKATDNRNAIKELRKFSGTHFDAEIIEILTTSGCSNIK